MVNPKTPAPSTRQRSTASNRARKEEARAEAKQADAEAQPTVASQPSGTRRLKFPNDLPAMYAFVEAFEGLEKLPAPGRGKAKGADTEKGVFGGQVGPKLKGTTAIPQQSEYWRNKFHNDGSKLADKEVKEMTAAVKSYGDKLAKWAKPYMDPSITGNTRDGTGKGIPVLKEDVLICINSPSFKTWFGLWTDRQRRMASKKESESDAQRKKTRIEKKVEEEVRGLSTGQKTGKQAKTAIEKTIASEDQKKVRSRSSYVKLKDDDSPVHVNSPPPKKKRGKNKPKKRFVLKGDSDDDDDAIDDTNDVEEESVAEEEEAFDFGEEEFESVAEEDEKGAEKDVKKDVKKESATKKKKKTKLTKKEEKEQESKRFHTTIGSLARSMSSVGQVAKLENRFTKFASKTEQHIVKTEQQFTQLNGTLKEMFAFMQRNNQ